MAAPVQPAPAQPQPYPYRSPWQVVRVLFFIGAVCEVIAALCFSGITHGPALAWLAGGLAAVFLAWAVP